MTVAEAAQRWNVGENTVIKYLVKGFIYDISIENNQLVLPEIGKPKIVPNNCNRSSTNIFIWILEACENGEYINAAIIGISEDFFAGHIGQLINEGCLAALSNTKSNTNIGYIITEKGINRLHPKKKIARDFNPTFSINLNTNIGAGNVML